MTFIPINARHNIIVCGLQLSGLGKIKPNTLVVGFKTDWTTCSVEELEEYVALLQ